jgi:hypothetical protein
MRATRNLAFPGGGQRDSSAPQAGPQNDNAGG